MTETLHEERRHPARRRHAQANPVAQQHNTSSWARLQALPAVFRGADLTLRFQWTSRTASQYLYRWKQQGRVQAFGGHSDVFANLQVQPKPPWEQALLLAMPSALIIGIECLRRAGWTTQIPSAPEVAVCSSQPRYATPWFHTVPCSAAWLLRVAKGVRPGQSGQAAPQLSPTWALADMLHRQGWAACGLTPDDLDWSAVTPKDRAEWPLAAAATGKPTGPMWPALNQRCGT